MREHNQAPVDFKFILQIHDEFIFEVKEDEALIFAGWAAPNMEKAMTLSVPIVVEAKMGKSWGGMKPIDLNSIHEHSSVVV